MSFTLNELALLLIALVVGWLLGLMMSGRGKYHRLYRDEEIAHRNAVKERDAALRERDARIEAANVRIAELERQSGPIGPGTATAVGGAVHGRDDLSRIRGVSQAQEATLEARLGLKPGTIAHEDWRGQARTLDHGDKPGLLGRLTGSA